ncbi:WhiB family transcriptional regulator [Streptomyces sp. NBC_01485]|uniref:WhiB family transcriptional regulator n=1 Tax=Streptomyces sp. NBC_01485 TaxID=2903884 RepID=UPI002E3563DE|nr:WhiB family transcriptional regulator [Streptomyces sp. NBC_01485]
MPDTRAHRHDWMERMACRNEKPETFSESSHEHQARIICVVRCPVRAQCLAHVQSIEHGLSKDRRDGVVAGLTGHERWRLDATAVGHSTHPALVFTGVPPKCGTYTALLRHLWLGERIDPGCWSAEVRRDRLNRATTEAGQAETKHEAAAAPVPPTAETTVPQAKEPPAKGDTPHERRVYRLWTAGRSDLQIARRMAVSVPQVQRVRERLGLLPNLHTRKAS